MIFVLFEAAVQQMLDNAVLDVGWLACLLAKAMILLWSSRGGSRGGGGSGGGGGCGGGGGGGGSCCCGVSCSCCSCCSCQQHCCSSDASSCICQSLQVCTYNIMPCIQAMAGQGPRMQKHLQPRGRQACWDGVWCCIAHPHMILHMIVYDSI